MFVHTHRVTYAECTVGNHIYHSRYLDLLEAARGEFLRSLGTTVLRWQENDVIFPVVEAHLRYKFPARYDDLLTIQVWLTLIEKIRVNFGHCILNQNGKVILEAETFHVCTGLDEKPKRVPEELVEKLRETAVDQGLMTARWKERREARQIVFSNYITGTYVRIVRRGAGLVPR